MWHKITHVLKNETKITEEQKQKISIIMIIVNV